MARQHLLAADPTCAIIVSGRWPGREAVSGCRRSCLQVFRDLFIQDARPQDARSVWERLVPQPFQPWAAQLELREFYRAGLPKSYIAVADDRALPAGTWHPGMSS